VSPATCPASSRPSITHETPTPYAPLTSYQSTPKASDLPSKTVLLQVQASTERMELGPSQASGSVVASATPTYEAATGWTINFTLSKSGCPIWDALATKNYHYVVADDLGGSVISAPMINATGSQFGCSGEITGITHEQASSLALLLTSGAFPLPLRVADTQTRG
jgi:preprotein translocase subunit SecD